MRDVSEQLDSYQSHLDAVYPAVTVEEVFGERLVELESLGAPSQRTWRPVAAFVAAFVAVVAVGVSVYFLGSTDTVATDSTPLVATTAADTPAVPVSSGDLAEWRWEQVAVGSLWADSVLDLAAFDNGGFVALTDADGAVYWSPDGTEWINADPNRVLSPFQDRTIPGQVERQLVATVGNQAVILGSADAEPFGLWVGDPTNGEWRFLPLDTNGISEGVRALAVASNETQVLVVGIEWTEGVLQEGNPDSPDTPGISVAQYLVWKVDFAARTTERHTLLGGTGPWTESVEASADWYEGTGRWIVVLLDSAWIGDDDANPVLTSPDGATWTELQNTELVAGGDIRSMTSLTAGDSSIIATVCNFGGDKFYVSTDGAEWTATTAVYAGHRSVYSGGLGFAVVYDAITHSPDGQTWTPIPNSERGPSQGRPGGAFSELNLAATDTAILLASDVEPGLWIYTKP